MQLLRILRMAILSFLAYVPLKLKDQAGVVTMPNWWVQMFHKMIHVTYQQTQSLVEGLLSPNAVHRGVTGALDYFERLGAVLLGPIVRHGQTPILNPGQTSRVNTLVTRGGGILLANLDKVRTLTEPQNEYRNALVFSALRTADKFVIDAATGVATTKTSQASGQPSFGSQALPSSRKIGGATAMDLARIINSVELLSKGSVPSGAKNRAMLYSPGQLRDILAITQASSSDFTKNQIHDRGTIDGYDWEGFHWVEIPDVIDIDLSVLERMLALSGTTRSCIAMARDAVGLSIAQQFDTSIDKRPDLSNEIQVFLEMTMNAVRIFEGGVVQVDALEN